MSKTIQIPNSIVLNGLNVDNITSLAGKIQEDEEYGKFKFRASNRWITGARSKTSIQRFFAGGKEDTARARPFFVDTDQPAFLAGTNTAPNAVEHILHALTSCLTTTLVYHASVQGIAIEAIETSAEGDLNSRGFFGISDKVNKGYERVRVKMHVKSDASVEKLTELAMHSPVYEMVSKAVPVNFTLLRS
jgi:uncharacterized OsmC-like protein